MTVCYSPEDKLSLVLASYQADNVRAFCREHGLDPTTLYDWRRELAAASLVAWGGRRRGRPSTRSRETVDSLRLQLKELAELYRALQGQAERWRLWAELAQSLVERRSPGAGLTQLLAKDNGFNRNEASA